MKNGMRRLTCLLVALALMSGLLSGLAEAPVAEQSSFELTEGGEVSPNDANGDIDEKKKGSKDTTEDKLTADQIKDAKELNDKVSDLMPMTGSFELDGKKYTELLDGTPEEKIAFMKNSSSKDMFYKLLTKTTPAGKDVFYSVWLPVATATLLGGDYNNFYYVDTFWTPQTFKQAFLKWESTWCHKKAFPSEFTNSGYRTAESDGWNKYQYATNFREVGEYMRQSLKDNSDYVYKGLKGDKDGFNDILKNWKAPNYKGDIFFVPFTEIIHRGAVGDESHGHDGYAWDSFAVCFYDFKLKPMNQFLQTGENGTDSVYVEQETGKTEKVAVMLGENKGAEAVSFNATKTDSETTTTSTTLSTSSTVTYSQTTGTSYTHNFTSPGVMIPIGSVSFSFNYTSGQSDTTSEAETTGTSKSHSDTWAISGTLNPATRASFTQSVSTAKGAISFSCPVELQYKVAILSLCGKFSGALPYQSVDVKHAGTCRIFGEDSGDAMADLADRLRHPETDNFNLDFSQDGHYSFLDRDDVHTNRFYSSVGGKNTFVIRKNISSASALTPLYPLNKTKAPADKTSHIIRYNADDPTQNRLYLETLPVEGVAVLSDASKTEVPYYGFDRTKGQWKLVDADGDLIENCDEAAIETSPTGTFLVAKQVSEEPVYLKYFINDGVYPKDPLDDKSEFLKNGDLASSAIVEVLIRGDQGEGESGGTEVDLAEKGKNPDVMVHINDTPLTVDPEYADKMGLQVTSIKSSNKKVAEVLEDGKIVLHKTGKTTIVVTAKKNDDGKKKITAKADNNKSVTGKVNLIVFEAGVPLSLRFDEGDALTLGLDEKGVQLTAFDDQDEPVSELKWKSSKSAVVKVDNDGVLTPKKKGTAKITATSTQNKKAKVTIAVTVVQNKAENNESLNPEAEGLTVEPEAPVAPVAEPEAPAAEPEAPAAEPETPAAEPEAPAEGDGESVASERIEDAVGVETVELGEN